MTRTIYTLTTPSAAQMVASENIRAAANAMYVRKAVIK